MSTEDEDFVRMMAGHVYDYELRSFVRPGRPEDEENLRDAAQSAARRMLAIIAAIGFEVRRQREDEHP